VHSPFFRIAALVVVLALVASTGRGQVILPICPDQAPDEFLKWAKQTAVPLAPSESANDFRDLRSLRKAIGGARVVGLGEAARRVQEFYELRTRLVKFLVEDLGFTGIAMETGFAEAIKANDYVLGRIAEPANWQDWFTLGFGDELETQAMLRWMRQYNQDSRHLRKIHFYGVDVMASYSNPETALNVAFAYLDQVDPAFVSSPTRMNLQALVHKFLGSQPSRISWHGLKGRKPIT
jgi:erythromycin esterase